MTEIIIAIAVVGAVGLAAGILLALISHFFGIEKGKTMSAISEALPGVNCGACGYRGCDDYALALSKGEAAPNKCVPGGEATAQALGKLLGIEVEAPRDVVAFVHCNGNCEATGKKAVYEGIQSCRSAALVYGGPNQCRFGCMGYGDCALACPTGAICMKDGIAHIDTSKCLGCGLCESICPKKVISMVPQETTCVVMCNSRDKGAEARRACKNACIGCKKCEKACESGAITVSDNLARIDYDKCTGCGSCAQTCPTGAIKNVFLPDIPQENEQ